MDLKITHDVWYIILTFVGMIGYWLNFFDNEKVRLEAVHKKFFVSHYLSDNLGKFFLNLILVIVGNMIWAEYIHGKHERAFIYAELFTLAWGGGSVARSALKMIEFLFEVSIKKIIEKFKS